MITFVTMEGQVMEKKKTTRATKVVKKASGSRKGEEKLYECKSCGRVTTDKGHLCSPREVKKAYTCEYCGISVTDPRHVCKPKVVEMSYVCDACGRIATDRNHLCEPKRIR